MKLSRLLRHLLVPDLWARRTFSPADLKKIEQAIRASEGQHDGQIRFVVEATLPLFYLAKKRSSRKRALDLFSQLRVWDTEKNSGVLVYLQLVSRHIDIVADRGISHKVPQAEWDSVCRAMEAAFRRGEFLVGSLHGIARITELLRGAFPKTPGGENELPDRPIVL
ncbi:MAG: TPM domain-containing protein [Betaproteobacteria bacterium]|nr:TPM domain-containing protein [Betaproteobacteria bacterium]